MLIAGGLPDAGKSNGVNQILAHAALCPDVALWLFDGKENELTTWTPLADRVSGTTWTTPSTLWPTCKGSSTPGWPS